jgi:hypothetical protein
MTLTNTGLSFYSYGTSTSHPYVQLTGSQLLFQYDASNSISIGNSGLVFYAHGASASLYYEPYFSSVVFVAGCFTTPLFNTTMSAAGVSLANGATLTFTGNVSGPFGPWFASASSSMAGWLGVYIGANLVKIPCYCP